MTVAEFNSYIIAARMIAEISRIYGKLSKLLLEVPYPSRSRRIIAMSYRNYLCSVYQLTQLEEIYTLTRVPDANVKTLYEAEYSE